MRNFRYVADKINTASLFAVNMMALGADASVCTITKNLWIQFTPLITLCFVDSSAHDFVLNNPSVTEINVMSFADKLVIFKGKWTEPHLVPFLDFFKPAFVIY